MKASVAKMILAEPRDDMKWQMHFWRNSIAKKMAIKIKAKAGLKLRVKGKKTGLKIKAKKPKAKAGLKLKVKAKKHRRMQATTAPASDSSMNVSSNGVNLNDAKFKADVPQPTSLAGDGQTSPAKSWMMAAG